LRSPSGSRCGGTAYARLVELETIDVGESLVAVHGAGTGGIGVADMMREVMIRDVAPEYPPFELI
jgi:malic enzyme